MIFNVFVYQEKKCFHAKEGNDLVRTTVTVARQLPIEQQEGILIIEDIKWQISHKFDMIHIKREKVKVAQEELEQTQKELESLVVLLKEAEVDVIDDDRQGGTADF